MSNPQLSVIIPVYNVENYVRACLQSVANQTLKEVEVIIVDDGSTDGSSVIVEEMAAKHENFRVVRKENGGLPAARNTGLEHATGTYVAFLDSDDFVDPEMYEVLIHLAESTGAETIKCGMVIFFDESGDVRECKRDFEELTEISSKQELITAYLNKRISCVVWNGIYHSRLFKSIRFPEGVNFEDRYTTPEILLNTNKFIYTPEILCYYRKREQSITGIKHPRHLVDQVQSANYLFSLIKEQNMAEATAPLLSEFVMSMVRTYHHLIISKKPSNLRRGRQSVADLLDPHLIRFLLKPGNLSTDENRSLKLMLRSHYLYFVAQKSRSLFERLKPTSKSTNSPETVNTDVTEQQAKLLDKYGSLT